MTSGHDSKQATDNPIHGWLDLYPKEQETLRFQY